MHILVYLVFNITKNN